MRIGKWLNWAEDGIYIATGAILGLAAVVLLGWSVIHFVRMATEGDVGDAVVRTLDSLLLVLMIAEILHTVRITIRGNILVIEPFLIVGIIAAVRRILIVTAEQAHPTAEQMVEFQMAMLELGILTFMVLALVGAVYVLRRYLPNRQEQSQGAANNDMPERKQAQSERASDERHQNRREQQEHGR